MSDEPDDDKMEYFRSVVSSYVRDPALTERNRTAEENASRAGDSADDGAEDGEGESESDG